MSVQDDDATLPDHGVQQSRVRGVRKPLFVVFIVFSLALVVGGALKIVTAPKIKEADMAELVLTGLILLVVAIALIVMTVRGRRSGGSSTAP